MPSNILRSLVFSRGMYAAQAYSMMLPTSHEYSVFKFRALTRSDAPATLRISASLWFTRLRTEAKCSFIVSFSSRQHPRKHGDVSLFSFPPPNRTSSFFPNLLMSVWRLPNSVHTVFYLLTIMLFSSHHEWNRLRASSTQATAFATLLGSASAW